MATDKKSQHVGNHGGAYLDGDSMRKQFTYIDHDRNTTRLKLGREYKEPQPERITPQQQLIRDILESGAVREEYFIEQYDNLLRSYGMERYRKGKIPEYLEKDVELYPDWYDNLITIFKNTLNKIAERVKKFSKNEYGRLQKQSN